MRERLKYTHAGPHCRPNESEPQEWAWASALRASLMSLLCSRAEDSPGTVTSDRRVQSQAGFEAWRLLMQSRPFLAGNFGLEPVHIRVLSPLGAFHTLQTSFYGG